MKIEKKGSPFEPVIVTLESQAEVDALFGMCGGVSTLGERASVNESKLIPEYRKKDACAVDIGKALYTHLQYYL